MTTAAVFSWRTRPLLVGSLAAYGVFLALSAIGLAARGALNGLVFLWTYPLLLALQKCIDPGQGGSFIAASVLGIGLVLGSAYVFQRAVGLGKPRAWLAVTLSLVFWYVPLLALQAVAFLVARTFGWTYGE